MSCEPRLTVCSFLLSNLLTIRRAISTRKEVEFAKLIEVLRMIWLSPLINEILDLSKIESYGRLSLNLSAVPFAAVHDQLESTLSSRSQK